MRRFGLGACAFGVALASGAPAAADVRSLVVGVDYYIYERQLCGAVNDARDIADALRGVSPHEPVVLTDAQADRAAVIGALNRLVDESAPGDVVVFTFAGHGSQHHDAIWNGDDTRTFGDEDDGLDEFLVLSGFQTGAEDAFRDHAIIDDELDVIFGRAEAAGVRVVFVSDTCHAGRMDRSTADGGAGVCEASRYLNDDETGRTRSNVYALPEDEPPFDLTAVIRPPPRRNVVFMSAVPEEERTPEIVYRDQARGALSVAFAAAVRGAGDADEDGVLSIGEARSYVRARVRSLTAKRQRPDLASQIDPSEPLFEVPAAPVEPAGERPVSVRLQGVSEGERAAVEALPGVRLVQADAPAELVWDRSRARVIVGTQDVAAYEVNAVEALGDVIAGRRALERLSEVLVASDLDVDIAQQADAVFCAWRPGRRDGGDLVEFGFESLGWPVLMLNFTGLGGAQALNVYEGGAAGESFRQALQVTGPFGQATPVLVPAPDREAVEALNTAICDVSEHPDYCGLGASDFVFRNANAGVDLVLAFLEDHPEARIGDRPVFTAPPGEGGCPATPEER